MRTRVEGGGDARARWFRGPFALLAALALCLLGAGSAMAAGPGMTHVYGNASYADHAPDAGVEVWIYENHDGPVKGTRAYTDEAGNWDAGELPAGDYRVTYVVNVTEGGGRTNVTLASELVQLEAGTDRYLQVTLSGPRPEGEIEATVRTAEGFGTGSLSLLLPGGGTESGVLGSDGKIRLFAPTGTYSLVARGPYDDAEQMLSASVTAGHVTPLTVQLEPLPVPPGTTAQNEQQELAWLNQQRARWGLPAGVASVPTWSQACAAHDIYGAENNRLAHEEGEGLGASPGGAWAGLHAILAMGGGWGPESNPWNDAPIHLNQLMTPSLLYVGIDDSRSYQCMTTWPGFLRPKAPEGTIWTYPGNGTSGLPPTEYANELPTVPGAEVGITGLAGRELFVYEQGARPPQILSASLQSANGPETVRWVDRSSGISGYLTGGIIIPAKPLRPLTTYVASVTLASVASESSSEMLPQITHSWTFTTGRENPNGHWDEAPERQVRPIKEKRKRRIVRTGYAHGQVIVRGWGFQPGQAVVERRLPSRGGRAARWQVLARARVGAGGGFVARFRWPRRERLAFRVFQRGRSTSAAFNPGRRSRPR